MTYSVHQRIQALLQETNDAFALYEPGNADFAEFASLSISEFKRALNHPALTRTELKALLRAGMQAYHDPDPKTWTDLMAQHVAQACNGNVTA